AQVLTTSTSASAGSVVSVCPPCCESPIITSESTRFLGQPRETKPIFIREDDSSQRSPRLRRVERILCARRGLCVEVVPPPHGVTRYIMRGKGTASPICTS